MAEKWRHDPENQLTLRERVVLGAAAVSLVTGAGLLINNQFSDDRVVNPNRGNPTEDLGVVPSNEPAEMHGGVTVNQKTSA